MDVGSKVILLLQINSDEKILSSTTDFNTDNNKYILSRKSDY